MSSKADRKETPSRSQLIVEDPEAFVQGLKHRLALKEGIPESQQRLVFSVPQSPETSGSEGATSRSAEEIVGELGSWQAIVYQNGKAIGRLLDPQLSSAQTQEENWSVLKKGTGWAQKNFVVEVISVVYTKWQPVWLKNTGASKQLYLPVDSTFASSHYRIEVIGRSSGRPFAIPFSYQFSGRNVSIALSLEVQKSEYVKRHQLLRGIRQTEAAPALRNLAVECGKGLEGFTAILDAEDQPAWLKGVALHFAVVASRVFDDAAPAGGQQRTPTEKPPADAQSAGRPDSRKQVAKESWLPKMMAQTSSGKKTRSKQKGKAAALGSARGRVPGREAAEAERASAAHPELREGAAAGELPEEALADSLAIQAGVSGKRSPAGGRGRSADPGPYRKAMQTRQGEAEPSSAQKRSQGDDAAKGHVPRRRGAEELPGSSALVGAPSGVRAPRQGGAPVRGRPMARRSGSAGDLASGVRGQEAGRGESARMPKSASTAAEGPADSEQPGAAPPEKPRLKHKIPNEAVKGLGRSGNDLAAAQGGDDGDHSRWRQQAPKSAAALDAIGSAEETPSDSSLVTAVSEIVASSNASVQSGGPLVGATNMAGSGGDSSAGASFLTFGSFDSDMASGDDDDMKSGALTAATPQLPNGLGAEKPGVHEPDCTKAGGMAGSHVAQPYKGSAAMPSAPSSSGPSAAEPLIKGSGVRPEAVPILALGREADAYEHQERHYMPQLNGPALTAELQQLNMRPYDPLRMVGSPISPRDFGQRPTPKEPAASVQPLQMPYLGAAGLAQEEAADQGASGSDFTLANGRISHLFGAGQGASGVPNRARPGSSSEATLAADASRGSSASMRSTSQAAELVGTARSPATGAAFQGYFLYHSPATGGEPQRVGPLHPPRQQSLPPGSVEPLPPRISTGVGAPPDGRARQHEDQRPLGQPLRPFSAHTQRYDSSTGRTRSYDSAVDPGARALIADLRHAKAAAAAAEMGMGRIMTPPPPPPPRTPPMQAELDPYEQGIERQGSFQVPPPAHQAAFDSHGMPANDMERFMSSVTPVLELNGEVARGPEAAEALCLADVWRCFEESSLYGREVYTRSGRRGPALAYYTPTLSAIRVLLPCEKPEGEPGTHALPLAQHFESELPFNREPFSEAVAGLLPEAGIPCPWARLEDVRLSEIHPASWFAVAWYPVYRIPDAPLTTKFLTFHGLHPVPACETFFGALDPTAPQPQSGAEESAASPLCSPILGLKCAEQKGEPWLEDYNRSSAARSEWERRYQQLQAKAASLSQGTHLRVRRRNGDWEQPRHTHGDLDWFNRHP